MTEQLAGATGAVSPAAVPPSVPPALEVKDLRYCYRGAKQRALDGVSFSVAPGEIVLVAGPSGCGKTTLIRCLNGLIPRSYREGTLEGQVLLNGQDPSPLPLAAVCRHVGTVLQNPEKQIVASFVAHEVAFGLENLGIPRREMKEQVARMLQALGIAHLADRPTAYLSGGEKQKVAIAGALVMEPAVLLLDEPLSNLDPVSAREALDLFRRLADYGKAVVLIEHRVEDVLTLRPARALLLEEGRPTYWGDLPGFLEQADPEQLKLPAEFGLRSPRRRLLKETTGRSAAPGRLLELQSVSYHYGDEGDGKAALTDVSLAVAPGEVVAILGANGAGKSTLLKLGVGLLRPRAGNVLLGGAASAEMTTATMAQTVGYVFQDPTRMFFAPTVREELAFGPRNLGFPKERVEETVEAALKTLDLLDLADRPPLSLSFGQQKRVSIAAVVAMRSRVLLLDEPTAGQDTFHTHQLMDTVTGLSSFEAVVFITHDLDLALEYATRVVLLEEGKIRADGPPGTVLADLHLLEESRLRPTSRLQALLTDASR